MVRKLICFSILWISLFAKQTVIQMSAQHILANQIQGEMIISGNVVIERDEDVLYADKAIVKIGQNKKPSRFQAIGNVSFKLKTQDGRKMQGKANLAIYDAIKDEYRLIGKAQIQEKGKANAIRGKEIVINRKNGSSSVVGDQKKPAKIIFTLDEKNAK